MLLELFRNHKRWLMFIAMILVIPSFVVTGIYSYNRMMSDDGAIAKVDDVSITPQQYDEVKRQQLDNLRQRLGENFKSNLLDTAEGRWAVLQSIMNERSLMGEVAKEFVSVPEETAIEVIKTYPAFQENGKFSAELYQNYLASTGYSDQYFVERVRQDVSRQLLTAAFTRTAGAPESVVKEVNKLLTEKRTMEVMAFNADDYKKGVTVTQALAKDYWTKNPKAFAMPDEADVEYVVFSPELFKNVEPTKEDIETFYAQNRNRFNAPEERRASHILIDLKDGKDAAKKKAEEILKEVKADPKKFAELAKKYSADAGSAKDGGDLNWFGKGVMVPAFEEAVYKAKKGEIVGPVETDFGFHIIEVTDIKGQHVRPLAEVRDEIVRLYQEQHSQEKFGTEAENFTNMVYEQSDSLQPVADKYGMKIETVKNVTPEKVTDPALAKLFNDHVLESIFSDEVAREKRNTQAIEVGNNQLVSARVVNFRPAHTKPFDEAKAGIIEMLTQQKALEKAGEAAGKLIAAFEKGDMAQAKFVNPTVVSRSAPGNATINLVNAVMRADITKLPAYVGVADGNVYRIVKITKSETPEVTEAALSGLRNELQQMLSRADESAYYGQLRAKHKAEVLNKNYLPDAEDKLPGSAE